MQNISPPGVPVNPEPIYLQAIAEYGETAQADQTIEECAELIVALRRRLRDRNDDSDVAEEIADVLIMCGQMRLVYGPALVDAMIQKKLRRLEERLAG